MKVKIGNLSKGMALFSSSLGAVSLLFGLILSAIPLSAGAASSGVKGDSIQAASSLLYQACTPPEDWDKTERLYRDNRTKVWTFQIPEPEMDVTLEFFYYQDYDPRGCPFDCSTGACQMNEEGEGESPLGPFTIQDGKKGADGGSVRLRGRLQQGEYQASFTVVKSASINIGLRVHKHPVETATPVPQPTDTPEPPATDTAQPPTATATEPAQPPTATATDIPATPTATDVVSPPEATATGTPPTPTATAEQPTPTATDVILPPEATATSTPGEPPTATSTRESRPPEDTATPPATLAPPSKPGPGTRTPVLIPVTGADLSGGSTQANPYQPVFLNLGLGLLGLALVLYGIGSKLSRE